MKRPTPKVDLHPDAAELIHSRAVVSRPRETGGLLLGWWDGETTVIRYAVEVTDPDATSHSWSRAHDSAQTALASALERHEHPWLGYVGDWHSHPLPRGASQQDRVSIRRASTAVAGPAVLLVHRGDGEIEFVMARRGRLVKGRWAARPGEGEGDR